MRLQYLVVSNVVSILFEIGEILRVDIQREDEESLLLDWEIAS